MPEGDTATNPETGERFVFTGGQWRPIRPLMREVGRQLGLAARAGIESAASIPDIVAPFARFPMEAVTGQPLGSSPTLVQRTSEALTRMGLPEPETNVEQLAQVGMQAAVPGMGMIKAGQMGARAPGLFGSASRMISEQPVTQTIATTLGATGGEAVRQQGGGPAEQLLATGAGVLAPTAARGAIRMPAAPPALMDVNLGTDTRVTARIPVQVPRPQQTQQQMFAQLERLVAQARAGGRNSEEAIRALAAMTRVNPEARAAAERLGFNIPPDVFGEGTQIQQAIGLTRSAPGSMAESQWRDTVDQAAQRAEELLGSIGGGRDVAGVSSRVNAALNQQIETMRGGAGQVYKRIFGDAQTEGLVPRRTPVNPDNIIRALNARITDLGGISKLTPGERRLLKMVTDEREPFTIEALRDQKFELGQGLGSKAYGNLNDFRRGALYDALRADERATVGRLGGKGALDELIQADNVYARAKDIQDARVAAFGQEFNRSIVPTIQQAVSQGAKGNVTRLNQLLEIVPQDMRGQALATAILDASFGVRAGQRQFNFNNFARIYNGLRDNPEIYDRIMGELGPDARSLFDDLALVSQRMARAQSNIITTGRANVDLVKALTAEGLVAQALNSTLGRVARGIAPGPLGALMADAAKAPNKSEALRSAGDMFVSPEFQTVLLEIQTSGRASARAQQALQRSEAFQRWATASGLENPEQWLRTATSTGAAMGAQERVQ